jgi:hypothetical protein
MISEFYMKVDNVGPSISEVTASRTTKYYAMVDF